MRSLGHLFQEKKSKSPPTQTTPSAELDAKTVFFLFERIVREYYGKRGGGVIHPARYERGVLFIKVASPLWANELLIQEGELCARLNEALGGEVIQGLQILHGLSGDEEVKKVKVKS